MHGPGLPCLLGIILLLFSVFRLFGLGKHAQQSYFKCKENYKKAPNRSYDFLGC